MQFLDNEYLIGGKDTMIKIDVSAYCRLIRIWEKNGEKHKLAFSWLSLVWFSMKNFLWTFMESVTKNVCGVTIVNNEIECADRIVYETGTYKAVVIRAGECIISL